MKEKKSLFDCFLRREKREENEKNRLINFYFFTDDKDGDGKIKVILKEGGRRREEI